MSDDETTPEVITVLDQMENRPRFRNDDEAFDALRAIDKGEDPPDLIGETLEKSDRPVFKDHGKAVDAMHQRSRERAADAKNEEALRETRKREHDAQVMATAHEARRHAEAVQLMLPNYQQRVADHARRKAALATVEDEGQRRSQELTLMADEQTLGEEAQRFRESAHAASLGHIVSMRPGLAAEGEYERLEKWAREQGISDQEIANARPEQIIKAYDQYRGELRETRAERESQERAERQRITDRDLRPVSARAGSEKPRTSDEALGRLKKTGKVDDALNALTLKRIERAKALL